MKVSTKLFVLIFAAILLFVSSFIIDSYFNRTVQGHNTLRTRIQAFEISLLKTIVKEKEYNNQPDSAKALKVVAAIEDNIEKLTSMSSTLAKTQEEKADFNLLSTGLQSYNDTFKLLAQQNETQHVMMQGLSQMFENFHKKSHQATEEINVVIGEAFIEGIEIDSSFYSFNALNEKIVASFMEIVLTINRELLLENDREKYQQKHEQLFTDLHRVDKKMNTLVPYLKNDSLNKFVSEVHEIIPLLYKSTEDIYNAWETNTTTIEQLNVERKSILDNTITVSSKCDRMVVESRTRSIAAVRMLVEKSLNKKLILHKVKRAKFKQVVRPGKKINILVRIKIEKRNIIIDFFISKKKVFAEKENHQKQKSISSGSIECTII